jgi:hypothetical protein
MKRQVKNYIEEFSLNRRLEYTTEEQIQRIGANELNGADL